MLLFRLERVQRVDRIKAYQGMGYRSSRNILENVGSGSFYGLVLKNEPLDDSRQSALCSGGDG